MINPMPIPNSIDCSENGQRLTGHIGVCTWNKNYFGNSKH